MQNIYHVYRVETFTLQILLVVTLMGKFGIVTQHVVSLAEDRVYVALFTYLAELLIT